MRDVRRSISIVFFMLLLLAVLGTAAGTTVSLSPLAVYETTTHTFNLTLNNFGADDEIASVKVLAPDIDIQTVADYKGWQENYTENMAEWYDGSLGTNVLLALFQLTGHARKVDQNQSSLVQIIVTDPYLLQ